MSAHRAPLLIDRCSAADFAGKVNASLARRDFHVQEGHAASALVEVFARFCEIVAQRLNRAPDKARLAFLDMLGASPVPPQPARVPLTFSVSMQSPTVAFVPAGTQVGAATSGGEQQPVVFEVQHDLVVTTARLAWLALRDRDHDSFTLVDAGGLRSPLSLSGGRKRIRHLFSLRHDAIGSCPADATLTVNFALAGKPSGSLDPRKLQWELWDGHKPVPLVLHDDTTNRLTQNGVLVFHLNSARQSDMSVHPAWLRCRLLTRITPGTAKVDGMVRQTHLPIIQDVTLAANHERKDISIEKAFVNGQALDTSKAFFPFGADPKFGDTLYLAFNLFPVAGAKLALDFTLVNPAGSAAAAPLAPTFAGGNPQLRWGFWDGSRWTGFPVAPGLFQDTTKNLTADGKISLTFPVPPVSTKINGIAGYWIRAILASGSYGQPARPKPGSPEIIPATLAPPSTETVSVTYSFALTDRPESFTICNDFVVEDVTAKSKSPNSEVVVFKPSADPDPILYLGFEARAANDAPSFLGRSLGLYLDVVEIIDAVPKGAGHSKPQLVWEWWTEAGWTKCVLQDETDSLTRPGLVRFLVPPSASLKEDFGKAAYWLRAAWQTGVGPPLSALRGSFLNSTMATQAITLRNEVVGSSSGRKNQVFFLARKPVVVDPQLQVWEPDAPGRKFHPLGDDSNDGLTQSVMPRPKGEVIGGWVAWGEVPDFYGSSAHDRHYVLDHLTGRLIFGDGIHGMIPPAGAENIRVLSYRSGGGLSGNKPTGTITELKTSLPYVEKVTNPVPGSGGADSESEEALVQRVPRSLRHGQRAVTAQDYEDLTLLASPAVARAHCVCLYDLSASAQKRRRTDCVSLILVPRSTEPEPLADDALKEQVRSFLDFRRAPGGELVIVSPEYCRVGVAAQIVVNSADDAYRVEQEVGSKLTGFLHPVGGGVDGKGWEFNRLPNRSDFYVLIESFPGVKYVRALEFELEKPKGFFLVSSGQHRVTLTTE